MTSERRCGYTFSQTGQPFSSQNTYRRDITGVRNFLLVKKIWRRRWEENKLHIWKHEKLLLCLSFAKLFLLIVHEAKNVSTQLGLKILCSHLRSDYRLQRRTARLRNAHCVLYGAIEPERHSSTIAKTVRGF